MTEITNNLESSTFFAYFFIFSNIEAEIENYKAAFHEHDEDGSGNISTAGAVWTRQIILIKSQTIIIYLELGAVMKKLGENPTEEQLMDLVNKVKH